MTPKYGGERPTLPCPPHSCRLVRRTPAAPPAALPAPLPAALPPALPAPLPATLPPRLANAVDASTITFDSAGLVPCIVQDWASGEVLMLAYMNADALTRTLQTRELHFWSRSRAELWHKGATSGNVQHLRAIRYDCDADALLAIVEPAGPACHTGERTCFYRGELEPAATHEVLPTLERTIAQRAASKPDGSYTAALLANPAHIGEKVQEEAEEVARAAREETDERVAEEAADVLYHLCVLLAGRGLTLADAERVLDGRRRG